jgi:hypothetical protein
VKKGSKTIKPVGGTEKRFAVGDDVFCTDGTWSNQLAREWNTVTRVTPTSLTLKHALTRDHVQAGVANVMELPRDNTFRGITFASELSPVVLLQALRTKFAYCKFARNANFGNHNAFLTPIDSGFTDFDGCDIDQGLHLGQAYRTTIADSLLAYLTAEEHSTFTTATRCTIAADGVDPFNYNGRLDTSNYCTDWKLTDCKFYGRPDGVFVYDRWNLAKCKFYSTGDVTIRGGAAVLDRCTTDGRIAVEAKYHGAPIGAGKDVVIKGSVMDWLWLKPETTGDVSSCVVGRETDETSPGSWEKSEILPGE